MIGLVLFAFDYAVLIDFTGWGRYSIGGVHIFCSVRHAIRCQNAPWQILQDGGRPSGFRPQSCGGWNFYAHSGASKVGRTDVSPLTINDGYLEVDART